MKAHPMRRMARSALLVALSLIVLYPFFLLTITSLKSKADFSRNKAGLPREIVWENYETVFVRAKIPETAWNSLTITATSVFFQVLIGSLAAYALSKMRIKRADVYTSLFLIPMIFSSQVVIIPLFLMFRVLKLLNTAEGLIIVYVAGGLPMSIFMLSRFMKGVPDSLSESALLDGAGHWQIYWRVVMPLTKVAISTLVIVNGLSVWNDFFLPFMFFTSGRLKTLPLNTYLFTEEHGARWNLVCTNMVYTVLPMLMLYLFLQKYIIHGVVAGAVKG